MVSGSVYLKNGSEMSEDSAWETILQDCNTTAEPLSINFFYNTHCGACHSATAYLDEYLKENPGIVIYSYDLFNNSGNRELFETFKAEYNRQYASVPIIFMGNAVLEGNDIIRSNLDPLLRGYAALHQRGFSLTVPPWFTHSKSWRKGMNIRIPQIFETNNHIQA